MSGNSFGSSSPVGRRFGYSALGRRIGLATSAAIFLVSLLSSLWRYRIETRMLMDQLHAHMGENVAAILSFVDSMEDRSRAQQALSQFSAAVDRHMRRFDHQRSGRHILLMLDPREVVMASTEPDWMGREIPPDVVASWKAPQKSSDKFRTVGLAGESYLFLRESLSGYAGHGEMGWSLLYLEPYDTITKLAWESLARNLGFSLVLALVLAVAVNFLVDRIVIRRLALLRRAMEQVKRGGPQMALPKLGTDELGEVRNAYAEAMNELGKSRRQIEEHARTLEGEIQSRTAQLVRAHRLAAVGELAAGLAHGLNNPLASVAASAEKLLDLMERDDDRLKRRLPSHLERILRNTDRCKQITRSLLSFAREKPFKPRRIHLKDVVNEAMAVVEADAETRGVSIALQMEDGLPDLVTDPDSVAQVLVNLLSNALDVTESGDSVVIEAVDHETFVRLSVTDSGPGIGYEEAQRIFRPFYTTKPAGKGTGLGLSICQALLEQLGGRMEVVSEVGNGARFEVFLPCQVRSN